MTDALELDDDTDWVDAEIEGDFVGVQAAQVELLDCRVTRSRFAGAVLENLRVTGTSFDDCDLSGALLYDANLTRVELRGCRLSRAVLAGARLEDVTFVDCALDGASLRGAVGRRLSFQGCRMPGVELANAQLAGAHLLDCDLTGASVEGANLVGARLQGSQLEEIAGAEALRGVIIDSGQAVPLGLRLLSTHGITIEDEREQG